MQQSAVEPPVAADNKRTVTKMFCILFVFIFTIISSLTELCRLYSCRAILVASFIYTHMYVTSAVTLMNATPCIIACTCMYSRGVIVLHIGTNVKVHSLHRKRRMRNNTINLVIFSLVPRPFIKKKTTTKNKKPFSYERPGHEARLHCAENNIVVCCLGNGLCLYTLYTQLTFA